MQCHEYRWLQSRRPEVYLWMKKRAQRRKCGKISFFDLLKTPTKHSKCKIRFFSFEMINCCLLKQKHSVCIYYTKQNLIHRAIQPYKNIWSGPYNQKVRRGSEIITNFGTQCNTSRNVLTCNMQPMQQRSRIHARLSRTHK
jgi:hypothetical protein